MGKSKPNKLANTKLSRIAELSRSNRNQVFNCVMPHFNKENLIGCFHELDGKKAVGIDKQTKEDYGRELESNIENLLDRMKNMAYRPLPVRLVNIPKSDGRLRPLGICCIEDKIVQLMMAKVLEAIYEPIFMECSFGFRPGRNCHQAIGQLHAHLFQNWRNYVIDVDLENFFGSIDHSKLLAILRMKIRDERFVRYIARLLKSGIISDKGFKRSSVGTTQGSVCSPILANIFAHYAIDIWVEKQVKPAVSKRVRLIRYCDDFIIVCSDKRDSDRILKALPLRLERFSLKINMSKTRVVTLNKGSSPKAQQGAFSFLGFSFYIGKTMNGTEVPLIRTCARKFRSSLRNVKDWCKSNRHKMRLRELWFAFCSKIRGYIEYYALSFNMSYVCKFVYRATGIFFKWINRRSQKKSVTWEQFLKFKNRFPLPVIKVRHQLF